MISTTNKSEQPQQKITQIIPHNHPTPQSPPSQFAMSGGTSNDTGSITSPNNHPPIIPHTTFLPTPSSSAAGTVPPTHDDETVDQDMMDAEVDSQLGISLKRRRSMDDEGDNERSRISRSRSRDEMVIDSNMSTDQSMQTWSMPYQRTIPTIQELLDMPSTGPLHHLCETIHKPTHPQPTTSLLNLYGLGNIAASVARNDPLTGEKRKLRKSYKGKILGLSGRNDVTTTTQQFAVPEGQEGWGQPVFQKVKGGLLEMLDWPEEEWVNQKVLGKELPKPGVVGGKVLDFAALRRGLSGWSKGPIPNYDAAHLALDSPSSSFIQQGQITSKAGASPANNATTPGAGAGASPNGTGIAPLSSENQRASRNKKRRYTDDVFEGYGEDPSSDVGNDDNEERKKKKKKRKRLPEYEESGDNLMPLAQTVGVGNGSYYSR